MSTTIASSLNAHRGTSRRRTVTADVTIACSAAAALAHLVAAPSHYTWWPAAGVFFVVLGIAQFAYALAISRGGSSQPLLLAGIWGTVAVILLYVASRTVGLAWSPPVPFHGGRWLPGRSMVPNGAKYVGPLDVVTLVAELVLVMTSAAMLSSRLRARTMNHLMWVGLALWGAGAVALW